MSDDWNVKKVALEDNGRGQIVIEVGGEWRDEDPPEYRHRVVAEWCRVLGLPGPESPVAPHKEAVRWLPEDSNDEDIPERKPFAYGPGVVESVVPGDIDHIARTDRLARERAEDVEPHGPEDTDQPLDDVRQHIEDFLLSMYGQLAGELSRSRGLEMVLSDDPVPAGSHVTWRQVGHIERGRARVLKGPKAVLDDTAAVLEGQPIYVRETR